PGDHVAPRERGASRAVRREHGRAGAEGARPRARAAADSELVARHEGIPRRTAEPVRVFAARAAAAVLASGAIRQSADSLQRPAALAARDRVLPADRLDVPADAAGARSHHRARPAPDDLLLHRRPRVELAGREAYRAE